MNRKELFMKKRDVYKRQVGYQYDGLTEEDRFVQKVLQEHYDKVYKENLSHSDPMTCLLYTSHRGLTMLLLNGMPERMVTFP